jgi:hypothetical protein
VSLDPAFRRTPPPATCRSTSSTRSCIVGRT